MIPHRLTGLGGRGPGNHRSNAVLCGHPYPGDTTSWHLSVPRRAWGLSASQKAEPYLGTLCPRGEVNNYLPLIQPILLGNYAKWANLYDRRAEGAGRQQGGHSTQVHLPCQVCRYYILSLVSRATIAPRGYESGTLSHSNTEPQADSPQ